MKNVIFTAAVLLASVNAFALGANDSWDKINASYDYIVEAPYSGFGPNGAFNMCATADTFQSIEPVAVCVQYSEPVSHGDMYEPAQCVKSEMKQVTLARKGLADVCVEWKEAHGDIDNGPTCVRFEKKPYELSTDLTLNVLYARGEVNYGNVAFTKAYSIPACAAK